MDEPQTKKTRTRKNGLVRSSVIQAVVNQIAEQFQPERAILFGPYAYGVPEPTSDVDLYVILRTKASTRTKQIEIVDALEPHPFAMHILVRTPEEVELRLRSGDALMKEIMRNGKVLYERPHG